MMVMDGFSKLLAGLIAMFNSLFGGRQAGTAPVAAETGAAPVGQPAVQPQPAQPASLEPATIVAPRVLVIVIDPIIDAATGTKLTQHMRWNRPEDLISVFISDLLQISGGLARYQIVNRIEINEFPVKADGFRYTPDAYLKVLDGSAPAHAPDAVDYQNFLTHNNILQLVFSSQIDEVWTFGFPYAGFYESTMGGYGAFFCNSQPLPNTAGCMRRFVVMGFSNERGVGEMLHSFGHRAESIMNQVYARARGDANLWQRYIRYDQTFPGLAEVGTVHFAPNSVRDYDYANPRSVQSRCDDWFNFPAFKGVVKTVDKAEWGGGDIRAYSKWWLNHLPKVGGRTNGIANNWWQYILDPNRVTV
jgi:hypothetical protein